MKGITYQIKVGLVVVIGIILAVGAYRAVLELNRESGYSVKVEFDNARGIKKGTSVQRAGTDIGWVSSVKLDPDRGVARAEVNIFPGITFPADAKFYIMSEGLIEEKYLSIRDNPNPNPLAGDAQADQVFKGQPDPGLTDMISNANLALVKVNTLLDVVEGFMSEEKMGGIMSDLAVQLSDTVEVANRMLTRTDRLIAMNEGKVTSTMTNVHALSEDMLALTSGLRGTVESMDIGTRMDSLLGDIDVLLADMKEISGDIRDISGDDKVKQDLKDSITLTKSTLEEAEKTLRTMRGTLERVNEKMDNIGPIGFKGKVNIRNESVHQTNRSDNAYVDVKTRLRVGDSAYDLGVENIGSETPEKVGVTAQAGKYMGNSLLFRGGIFRSEFGLGFDYSQGGGLGLTGDLYDINNPKLNSYLTFPLADRYNMLVGVEDIGDENQVNAGVQLSF
jgi:phospholipid/cholesterol/gamma-HCH transport system substrate-binding protein